VRLNRGQARLAGEVEMAKRCGWTVVVCGVVALGCSADMPGPGGGGRRDSGGGGGRDGGPDIRTDAPPRPGTDSGACSTENVVAEEGTRPVDIIWVIDNSGSMDREEMLVQTNMNAFASMVGGFGLDYHVIVIADTSHISITLADPTRLRQVNQSVDSHNAFEQVINTYPMYQDFLRPGGVRHIIVVSDDESDMAADTFRTMANALPPPGFPVTMTEPDGFFLHAIVAEDPPYCNDSGFPCTCRVMGCPCIGESAERGAIYIDLQTRTGGVFASLCQTDWNPIFMALATAARANTMLPCQYEIPPPPAGMTLDLNAVNLRYTPSGGAPVFIPHVASMADCGPGGGWYYDNPTMPAFVLVCPATCTTFMADPGGEVEVAFGCETIII
jgi:hypothetical protein